MSEEEIIKNIEDMLLYAETNLLDYEALAIQGLLDLYNNTKKSELILANKFQKVNIELNKEKEKNKELEHRLNQMFNKQQIYDLDEINRSHISFN